MVGKMDRVAEVAIVIVGFRNALDIKGCLSALSSSSSTPDFDIFISENGGLDSYHLLIQQLIAPHGPCIPADPQAVSTTSCGNRFIEVQQLGMKTRSSRVMIGCAPANLGYAGGVNIWLRDLLNLPGWKGVWILNPDTEPGPTALAALIERAESARKGMVGSTILESGSSDLIRFRGGLSWQTLTARATALGLHTRIGDSFDLHAIENDLDAPSGASTYATRQCVEQIGLMDESYFLFFEDLDWGRRAKALGLGYASNSIVAHQRGTTTGSANTPGGLSRLAVYLEHRNAIHFVRKHVPITIPIRFGVSLLCALRFLIHGAPRNCIATLEGLLAGLRGEIGPPGWYEKAQPRDERLSSTSVNPQSATRAHLPG